MLLLLSSLPFNEHILKAACSFRQFSPFIWHSFILIFVTALLAEIREKAGGCL